MLTYDVVIIGSGIAGMTSAIYLKRAGTSPLIIEQNTPGGQLNKSHLIENYPGFNGISGPELALNIYKQVKDLEVEYLYEKVSEVNFKENTITTDSKNIKYKYLIIASGRTPKKINLDNINHLSYCSLCDGNLYKNKDVTVLGGGNSALEDAIYLSQICNKVTIIHRKNKFNAEESLIDKVLKTKNINIMFDNEIKDAKEENDNIHINLKHGSITTNGLFICIGYLPDSSIYNLEKDKGYIIVNHKMQTSIPNVYACGDIIKKEYYQLTTATSEGTICASEIAKKISRDKNEN